MSAAMILMGLCIFGLIGLALFFISCLTKQAKNDAIHQRNSLAQKIRQVNDMASGFPAQFMSNDLMALLLRIELGHGLRLRALGDRSSGIVGRIAELEYSLNDLDQASRKCRPQPITSEEAAKALRIKIQHLHAIISAAMLDSIVTREEASRWSQALRNMTVSVYIEMFTRIAAKEIAEQNPRMAMSTLEQGIHFLRKQPGACVYAGEIEQFKSALAQASIKADEPSQSSFESFCQLTDSLDRIFLVDQVDLKKAS